MNTSNELSALMAEKTDQQLQEMFAEPADYWSAKALDAAKAELEKRNIRTVATSPQVAEKDVGSALQTKLVRFAQKYVPTDHVTLAGVYYWAVREKEDSTTPTAVGLAVGLFLGPLAAVAVQNSIHARKARFTGNTGVIAIGEQSVFFIELPDRLPLMGNDKRNLCVPPEIIKALCDYDGAKPGTNNAPQSQNQPKVIAVTPVDVTLKDEKFITTPLSNPPWLFKYALDEMLISSSSDTAGLPDAKTLREAIRAILKYPMPDEALRLVIDSTKGGAVSETFHQALLDKDYCYQVFKKADSDDFFRTCLTSKGQVRESIVAYLKRRCSPPVSALIGWALLLGVLMSFGMLIVDQNSGQLKNHGLAGFLAMAAAMGAGVFIQFILGFYILFWPRYRKLLRTYKNCS